MIIHVETLAVHQKRWIQVRMSEKPPYNKWRTSEWYIPALLLAVFVSAGDRIQAPTKLRFLYSAEEVWEPIFWEADLLGRGHERCSECEVKREHDVFLRWNSGIYVHELLQLLLCS